MSVENTKLVVRFLIVHVCVFGFGFGFIAHRLTLWAVGIKQQQLFVTFPFLQQIHDFELPRHVRQV